MDIDSGDKISANLLILANQLDDFQLMSQLLSKYFPSSQKGFLFLNTKYYSVNVEVVQQKWPELSQIPESKDTPNEQQSNFRQQDKQDLMIMLVNQSESFPSDVYDYVINKYNPENFILVVNTTRKQDPWKDQAKIVNQVNNFIEVIKEDLQLINQNPPQRIKKGLLYDNYQDGNIFNLLQLIETTQWSTLVVKKQQQRAQTATITEKQQPIAVKQQLPNKEQMNEGDQMSDEQLQKEMMQFEGLMKQMMGLKTMKNQQKQTSDQSRKKRAEQLLSKMLNGAMI